MANIRENWIRPLFFYGTNRISLLGAALATSSALILIGFWVVDVLGRSGSNNPYLGIVFDLVLPGLFVLGLLLIPVGMWWRRRELRASSQIPSVYPQIDLGNPSLRHAIDFILVATFINFVIVGTATYRGVAYMDTVSFCGQTCHTMDPEWTAYQISSHSSVACTQCHIASGLPGYIHAKLNGTKQLLLEASQRYPRPITSDDKIPAASTTCLNCHNAEKFIGDKLQIKASYGDDEKNSATYSVVLMHVGGKDQFGRLSGIHGAHLGRIEYIATDTTHQTIPWVAKVESDGSTTEYLSSDVKSPPSGQKRLMDCIDCHNRAAHSFDTPEAVLNKAMAKGAPDPSLPFIHKQGLALMKASYSSRQEAISRITSGLEDFYRTQYPQIWSAQRSQIDRAGQTLAALYSRNVFPSMKVSWGTHPNNLGHNDYPGCFRCHDGSHNSKGGKSINNDCSVCHNLIATDDPTPKQLAALGIQ